MKIEIKEMPTIGIIDEHFRIYVFVDDVEFFESQSVTEAYHYAKAIQEGFIKIDKYENS